MWWRRAADSPALSLLWRRWVTRCSGAKVGDSESGFPYEGDRRAIEARRSPRRGSVARLKRAIGLSCSREMAERRQSGGLREGQIPDRVFFPQVCVGDDLVETGFCLKRGPVN